MQWEHSPALYNDVLGNDGLPVWQWSIRILMDYKWVCLNCSKEKLLCLSLSLRLCLSVSTNSLPSAFLSFLSIFFLPLSHPQSEDPVWMKQPEIQKRSHQPWLVWLSWLVCHSVHLKVGVWFLIRAHTYVVGSIPSEALVGGNWLMYLSLSKINKHIFLIRRKERSHQKSTMLES